MRRVRSRSGHLSFAPGHILRGLKKGMDAMEMIRRYLLQIKSQLKGLTISQRLLIGLLAVFMIATIFFTVVWSAKPLMVPLIPQAMTPEDINKAEMALKGKHDYQVDGDKILVPAEQAYAIRGELYAADAMPRNLNTAFIAMIRDSSPFTTDAMNTRAWNNALQMELTRWLSEFPYVHTSNVIIGMGSEGGLGRAAVPSTASIFIRTKDGGQIGSAQLLSIVDLVSGAVSGLRRENVHVVVNGARAYQGPDDKTPVPANVLEVKKAIEDNLEAKLVKMFAFMGDVKFAVNVVPDLSVRTIEQTEVDPKNAVVKTVSESSQENNTRDGAGPGGEPGVQSNTGTSVAESSGSGRGGSSSNSTNKTENMVVIGDTKTSTYKAAGTEWKEMTASISLPRSFFVSIYRKKAKDPKAEPSDEELQKPTDNIIVQQIKSAAALAKNTIGAKTDDQIRVDWYDDTIMAKVPDAMVASAGFGGGSLPAIAQYTKQGVLALVALGAMGMMLMMVRRAVPAGADDDVDGGVFVGGKKGKRKGIPGVEQLDATDDVFGEANQGEAVLTGIELDDDTLASRKMVDEVSIMIKENPENAAALVKRWMTKSK